MNPNNKITDNIKLTENDNLDEDFELDRSATTNYEANKICDNPFLTRGVSQIPDANEINCPNYNPSACKLSTYNWMSELKLSPLHLEFPIAEVRFKNSRKEFYHLPEEGNYNVGDIVAVEATPGFDIGIISMLGLAVERQIKVKKIKKEDITKKIYRLARVSDIDKWISCVKLENLTMLSSRYIAWDINLKMKINDVEYQGDGSKAIFYYSSDERVDFRELIKVLAEQFKVRIEMKQIGVRQEAGRLGGIGTCGRELCCASWLTNFQSVSTSTARTQQLSLNPQKLAGQCGKLKCCLNFEQSTYLEEIKAFPNAKIQLRTKNGNGFQNKIDIFKKIVWYNYANDHNTLFGIPLEKVNEIIEMNKNGKIPNSLEEFSITNQKKVDEELNYSLEELKKIEDR